MTNSITSTSLSPIAFYYFCMYGEYWNRASCSESAPFHNAHNNCCCCCISWRFQRRLSAMIMVELLALQRSSRPCQLPGQMDARHDASPCVPGPHCRCMNKFIRLLKAHLNFNIAGYVWYLKSMILHNTTIDCKNHNFFPRTLGIRHWIHLSFQWQLLYSIRSKSILCTMLNEIVFISVF